MTDTHVIGFTYTHNGEPFALYLQQKYTPMFAENLASNLDTVLKDMKNTGKSKFMGALIERTLDVAYGYDSAITPTFPKDSDHTVHIVNIDDGTVELWDNEGFGVKVSFSFQKFIDRY